MAAVGSTATAQPVGAGGNTLEPDADAIKMFVGQIPKRWDENEMRSVLEEYGPIYYINILRDQTTGESKGCCFVTYYTRKAALDAQASLHDRTTLPGLQHPVQMKPADSEGRRLDERKLFIGMLSKSYTEENVRAMFLPYGTVEEVRVLRDNDGTSKGCAFAVFSTRSSAENAIRGVHHSTIMDGCSSPLVVKFAETQKEKEQKKMAQMTQQMMGNLWGNMNMAPQYMAMLQQIAAAMYGQNTIPAAQPNHAMQQMFQIATQQAIGGQQSGPPASSGSNRFGGASGASAQGQPTSAPATNTAAGTNQSQFPQQLATMIQMFQKALQQQQPAGTSTVSQATVSKQTEGPNGANLFIYHLPKEFTDTDLGQTFLPFGNVLSAKVFMDKLTNTSKGFGFVSFDNPASAQSAIQAMNGFQIGNKRLKVSLKRSTTADKPY